MSTKWLAGFSMMVSFGFWISGCTSYHNLQPDRPVGVGSEDALAKPIMYLDADGISGVFLDGRRLKTRLPYVGTMPTRSPDGSWFAYVKQEKNIGTRGSAALELMNLEGTVKTLFTTEKGVTLAEPIWSPDGQKIAVIMIYEGRNSPFSVAVINVSERQLASSYKFLSAIRANSRPKFKWSPDGQKLLLAWNTVNVINALNGAIETVVDYPVLAEWAPDSNGIYYLVNSTPGSVVVEPGDLYFKPLGSIQALKLVDREQIRKLGLKSPLVQGYDPLMFSPGGTRLAIWGSSIIEEESVAKGGTCVVHIYELEKKIATFDQPPRTFQSKDLCIALDWGADENSIAAVVATGDSIDIKLLELESGLWRKLATLPMGGDGVATYYLYGFKVMGWTR
jgi:dipeptidyl aminopeptidase/acylaminoacyl peptidase